MNDIIENEAQAFDATLPAGISENDYNIAATSAGFDEDNPLIRFEKDLAFCSLRAKLDASENDWLSQQPISGPWDTASDPDNHFIDDIVERTVLNEQAEVIVLDDKGNPVIYKFIDDEGTYITIANNDYVALAQINSGTIPTNNPNVTSFKPEKPSGNSICKDKNTIISYPENQAGRIKCITKLRREWGRIGNSRVISKSKIVAVTRGYRLVRNVWRVRRTLISASINGVGVTDNAKTNVSCGAMEERFVAKERRRRRVRVVEKISPFLGALPDLRYLTVYKGNAFTSHKQSSVVLNNADIFGL